MGSESIHPRDAACPVTQMALAQPELVAIRWCGPDSVREISYSRLDALLGTLAAEFDRRDVPEEGRVGLLIDDPLELLLNSWALMRAGRQIVLLNTRIPEALVAIQCRAASAAVVFTDREDLCGTRGQIRYYPTPSADVWDPGEPSANGEVVALPRELDERRVSFSDSATVVFTSGSTGEAKGALLPVAAHVHNAKGSRSNMPLHAGDSWMLTLPQYHVGGIAIPFRCFLSGATVVIPGTSDGLLDDCRRGGATHISLVATQLRRLVDDSRHRGERLDGLRVLVGGGAVPPALVEAAGNLGCAVHVTYGMTEMASQVATTRADGDASELDTCGPVLPHAEVRLGGDGRLFVRGESRFAGYVDEAGLERPFDADGWFATGDLGEIDDDGRLVWTGRADRMFISGGENIDPVLVETLIGRIPGIRRVAVVPVEDAEFGARPVAFVDPEPPLAHISRIRDTLSLDLPRYAIPTRYLAFPSDAETAISKIDYPALIAVANQSKSGR